MAIKTVLVFGATGFQGRAQLLALVRQGYAVKAVSRDPSAFSDPRYAAIEKVSADYDNAASLRAALHDVDAIFFQAPALGDNARLLKQCATLTEAIKASSVQLTVINSSMWAPDVPCGEIIYDGVLAMENVFVASGIPVIFFRPTLFMNNLLGDWVRSAIVKDRLYRYPHKADMGADWIALEDVANFMVSALERPNLAGNKYRIGGPQRLTTLQMLEIISGPIGHTIRHEYLTPRDFGEYFWHFFGATSGLDKASYVAGWDSFYTFNNDAPQKPFEADSSEALAAFPVERMTLADWAQTQSWR